jgi:hypothetical protein
MSGIAIYEHQPDHPHPQKRKLTCWVPSTQNDSTICRILFDLADALRQLINTLSGIIGIAGLVFSAKVSPLETVDRSQISLASVTKPALLQKLLGTVPIPDLDTLSR